uniref:Ig-like domain-containing protein n=1 Tax=Electrophorus electricus TaxID=8005 RepID=A0A4W4DPY5_ELEEL
MERALLILTLVSGIFCEDQIGPKEESLNIAEQESVKLSCSYESSSEYVYLYWYREHPHQAPQFLLWKGARSWSAYESSPPARFQSTTSRTSTELSITKAILKDSALYYCALRVVAQ